MPRSTFPFLCLVLVTLATPFSRPLPAQEPLSPMLQALDSPILLQGDENRQYRDPAALFHDGWFHLWITINEPRREGRSMVSFLGHTKSRDLKNWTPVEKLTPEDPRLNYSSPGNVVRYGGRWIICFQTYPIPGDGFIGDGTARLFIMHSDDLENWSPPELLPVKGPDVPVEEMGRMIDPYLLRDKDRPERWWCFYKQNGVSMSWTEDFRTWHYHGRAAAGENVSVLVRDGNYLIMHSPGADGMGILQSPDLKTFRDWLGGRIRLGYPDWPWAAGRLTAGTMLDLTNEPTVGKYLMFYHGSRAIPGRFEHVSDCSIGIAWSDDLRQWSWPGKEGGEE